MGSDLEVFIMFSRSVVSFVRLLFPGVPELCKLPCDNGC